MNGGRMWGGKSIASMSREELESAFAEVQDSLISEGKLSWLWYAAWPEDMPLPRGIGHNGGGLTKAQNELECERRREARI